MQTSEQNSVSGDFNGCNGSSSPRNQNNSVLPCFLYKTLCDPVHTQIELHPACIAIMDSPQFQRLREIKQTGLTDYVFPGATHNRFSHSLGVCYLAGKFLRELKYRQPELLISDLDILCVEVAGLCHDLGHGPFSHFWEVYINGLLEKKKINQTWKHENVSMNMLDYLIEDNDLKPMLESYGIGDPELNLIKDFIIGAKPKCASKAFLYQIVNNDKSGLDVDKWDYFLRDCYYLGLPCNFEYQRLIQCAKVLTVDGMLQICFRDKVLEPVYNIFKTRSSLHRLAYQHKVVITITKMVLDACEIADGRVMNSSGEIMQFLEWSMAAAFSKSADLKAALKNYCTLTDYSLISVIKNTHHPIARKAAYIMHAVERRSCKSNGFYQHVVLKVFPHSMKESEVLRGMCELLPTANDQCSSCVLNQPIDPVTPDDIRICIVPINWGRGRTNPIELINFYSKNLEVIEKPIKCQDALLPLSFQEVQVHVLCCRSDLYAFKVTKWCFEEYIKHSTQ